jgi:hypothetical protein
MRTAAVMNCLLALPLLAGCAGQQQAGPPVPLGAVVLYDVQGLFGGRALWASEGGTAFVQVVGPAPAGESGLWEKRYKTKLAGEQWAEAERLVGAHHFLTLGLPERPGVPDEACPVIAVVTKAGATAKARKWAGDKQPDFDALYGYLVTLCRPEGELVREGPFEGQWRPEGFEQPW